MPKNECRYSPFHLLNAIVIIVGLLYSCAEPRAPEGGPKDLRPPQFHKKKYSTPNKSTNFKDNQVILTFNEWVKLQAAYTQVVISPPLEEKPEIKIRNKSVVVKWDEVLKDSTTYTINFGDAVRDITENNIVPNLKMVFSTGPFLDSLTCTGQIVDAETRKPKADVLVMLYRNLEDSIPLTQKPYYFSKTDEQGTFKIENIKAERYRIFALDDKNSDYLYNLPNEEIAFLDSSFLISDTIQPALRLRMFKEREQTRVFGSRLLHYGCLVLDYNNKLQTASNIRMIDAPEDFKSLVEQGADTLTFWFDGTLPDVDKWVFVVENEAENLSDTVRINTEKKIDFEEFAPNLRWYVKEKNASNGRTKGPIYTTRPLVDTIRIKQHPYQPLELLFTRPLDTWDSTKIKLFKDTFITKIDTLINEQKDSITGEVTVNKTTERVLVDTFVEVTAFQIIQAANFKTKLQVQAQWQENETYSLVFLPQGVTDFFGFSNLDTLSRKYSIEPVDEYGSVTAIIKNADSTQQYTVQLVDAKGEVIQENIVRDSTQIRILYQNIRTDNYTIRIIHDKLANGRWDVGSYKENRQAEKTTNSKNISLNPGWENYMEVDLNPVDLTGRSKEQRPPPVKEE